MNIFTRLGLEDPMTSGAHVIRCRDTGEALANKLDGGECVCKPGECEMRKMRNGEGDYAKNNSEDEGFDAMGFAIGLATGFPISPRGITLGSIVGSLLHPTERHAAYDVTSATPTINDDLQPGTPAAPVRDVDFNDNSTSAPQPIDIAPATRDPDPAPYEPPQAAPPAYEPPSYTPPDPPSYTPEPQPSYSPPAYEPPSYTPDPSPSYDSSSSSFDSGSSSSDSGGGGGGGGGGGDS